MIYLFLNVASHHILKGFNPHSGRLETSLVAHREAVVDVLGAGLGHAGV